MAELIKLCNRHAARVLSLDVPSGLDATTGRAPGAMAHPERTRTLALPKTGLRDAEGEPFVADIRIPLEVFARIGAPFAPYAGERYWTRPLVRDET